MSSLINIVKVASNTTKDTDNFHEELYMKVLKNQQIYTYFQFTTIWNISPNDVNSFKHYRLFPKSLGDIIDAFSVRELYLSLTQNHWRHEQWGYPLNDASTGAEIWAWFRDKTTDIDTNWFDLTNVLSGMFCASLNSVNSKITVTPKMVMRPKGVVTKEYLRWQNQSVRYANLPRENVCTENLTPWKKLLPCGSKTGLAALLNSIKLYDTSYHSLALHFRPVCRDKDCKTVALELKQSVSVVFDPWINLGYNSHSEFSLRMLFSRMVTTTCPLATTSNIYVDSSALQQVFSLSPQPSYLIHYSLNNINYKIGVYDLQKIMASNKPLNLLVSREQKTGQRIEITETVLTLHRFITGHGQRSGGIATLIHNRHTSKDMHVAYMEVLPWYLHMYIHTLKIENNVYNNSKPINMHYIPGKDSLRPYHLELALLLPRASTTKISFQFDPQLLKWTSYPPDPNHGFYVPPAVVTVDIGEPTLDCVGQIGQASLVKDLFQAAVDSSSKPQQLLILRTEALLISLPTPDFSMPYNVICLVCTVVAIAFGSVHNLTTRSFVIYDPTKHRSLLGKVIDKIKTWWRKWRGKTEVVGDAVGGRSEGVKEGVVDAGVGSITSN